MGLKDYGRNFKLSKVYIQAPGLLMFGVTLLNFYSVKCLPS